MDSQEPEQPELETSSDTNPSKGRTGTLGPLRALGWLFVFGLLITGILVGAVVVRLVFPTSETPEQIVETINTGPDVVVAIRDLARLETAQYHVERVIDLRQQQTRFFGLVEAEDALLLVAAADVEAGVDLTQMSDGDVVIEPDEGRATLTLPAPEIFSAHLDNERTYVHTRDTDALAARDDHLETRARREAEATLRESAIESGILDRARRNAETALRTLVTALGYDHVEIRWRDQIEGTEVPEPQPEKH